MKRKSQNWVQLQARVQNIKKKLTFGNSGKILWKNRYETFRVMSNFILFSFFLLNILSQIRWTKFHLNHTILPFQIRFASKEETQTLPLNSANSSQWKYQTLIMQRQFSFFRPNLLQKEEYLNITMELSIFELVYRPILIIKKQF